MELIDPTRRHLLSRLLPAAARPGVPRLVMPSSDPPGQPSRVQTVDGLLDRLRESLPGKASGDADLDFALVAAPLLDLLAEMAEDRAGATKDPALRDLCRRVTTDGVGMLQGLIDWLDGKGHGAR